MVINPLKRGWRKLLARTVIELDQEDIFQLTRLTYDEDANDEEGGFKKAQPIRAEIRNLKSRMASYAFELTAVLHDIEQKFTTKIVKIFYSGTK